MPSVDEIEKLLPQTQCELCEYPGCRPYAEALVAKQAKINKCLPGGVDLIQKLATELNQPIEPGMLEAMQRQHKPAMVAIINEAECIGCTKCLAPCPTDAIIGSNKFMHTIIADDCTGCEKCVPTCPVDCISISERVEVTAVQRQRWQQLHRAQQQRKTRDDKHRQMKRKTAKTGLDLSVEARQQMIADAIARKKNKLNGNDHDND